MEVWHNEHSWSGELQVLFLEKIFKYNVISLTDEETPEITPTHAQSENYPRVSMVTETKC